MSTIYPHFYAAANNPHRRVRTQTMKGTLQRRHVKQMRQ